MVLALLVSITVISCSSEEENVISENKSKSSVFNNLNRKQIDPGVIKLSYNGSSYRHDELNDYVEYIDAENNFLGNIYSDSKNVKITDNTGEDGSVTFTNIDTSEEIIVKNINATKEKVKFDILGSNGIEINGVELEQSDVPITTTAVPVKVIVKAVVAIVSVVSVAFSMSDGQSNCTSSLPKNCPEGSVPYAEYTSGWFNSSCNVGCRK